MASARQSNRDMTIVIALGNEDQFIQLSDRRLSMAGAVLSDEADKAATFHCVNGRFALGFSGVAQAGGVRTREWLLEQLLQCAPPDYSAFEILGRLETSLSREFSSNRWLAQFPPEWLRLSVMFSGYLFHHDPPLLASAIITNFQDFQSGADNAEPWPHFKTTYWSERRPSDGPLSYVQRIGMWPAMAEADEGALRDMLDQRLPASAIVEKGVELIRDLADRPQARGAIGKQVSSITLPRDPREVATSDYHTETPSTEMFLPSVVVAVSKNECFAAKDLTISMSDASGRATPVAVPRVAGNTPCPCGSGRKYKNCHGRKEIHFRRHKRRR